MAFNGSYTTSLRGRRLGLQQMTTAQTGGTRGVHEFLVGPEALRCEATSAESTGTNLKPFGISNLPGTSAGSSAVYVLDPPIPGVMKYIRGSTDNGPVFVRTANSETISTTLGSSFTTVKISSVGGSFMLIGYTTALWMAVGLTSGTSSQASGFGVTTST
jgi:hypothetical protein